MLSKLGLCLPISHVGPLFSLSLEPLRVRVLEEGATKIGAVLDSISCEPLKSSKAKREAVIGMGTTFASISYEPLILLRLFEQGITRMGPVLDSLSCEPLILVMQGPLGPYLLDISFHYPEISL